MEAEVVRAIKSGRKVEAIKTLRRLRGIGLKEAKELVELYARQNNLQSTLSQNTSQDGPISLVIIIGVIAFFVLMFAY
ncbi:ribosomal protein L7/L12 [Gallaecimonas sp. GXIMD4217]|uniref:ribosomal protein L7/L12 n=1 Tax=Gallaecimonas sp. GXIMD4217 TaxID=3131927 RepID=UPI00311AD0BB